MSGEYGKKKEYIFRHRTALFYVVRKEEKKRRFYINCRSPLFIK